MGILLFLTIGALAGWLAGIILKQNKYGLGGNMAIGVIGSFLGKLALGIIGLKAWGLIGQIVSATIGAVLLLVFLDRLKK